MTRTNEVKRVGGQTTQATITFDAKLQDDAVEVTATRDYFGRIVINGLQRWSDGKHLDMNAADRAALVAAAARKFAAMGIS